MINYNHEKNYFFLQNENYCIDFAFGQKGDFLNKKSFPFVNGDFISLGQPHDNKILNLEEDFLSQDFSCYDGVITDLIDCPLSIRTADCIPVLITNIEKKSKQVFIAALHCGWRSVVAGIITKAMEKIVKEKKHKLTSLKIILGAAIDFRNYSFEEDGKKEVEKFLHKKKLNSNDYFYSSFQKGKKNTTEKYFFDLKKLIITEFLSHGCLYQNMINLAIDTYENKNYNSHRRERSKDRNYSVIQKRVKKQ